MKIKDENLIKDNKGWESNDKVIKDGNLMI